MLSAKEYEKVVRRPYPPFLIGLIFEGYRKPENYKSFLSKTFAYREIMVLDYFWYYPIRVQRKLAQMTFRDWRNPEFFKHAKQELKCREQSLLSASRQKDFKQYCQSFTEYVPSLALVYNVEEPVEKALCLALRKKFTRSETKHLMDVLNLPLEDNYLRREEYDLARTGDLRQHVRKYSWILSRYGERKPYTVPLAQAKRRQMNCAEIVKRYISQKAGIRQAIRKAKARLSVREQHLVNLLQFIVYYRTHRTDVMNRSAYEFYPGLLAKAKALKLKYSDLLFLLPDEIRRGNISRAVIKERQRSFACLLDRGKIIMVSGKRLRYIRKRFAEKPKKQTEIKGVTASPGKVVGMARIVRGMGDLGKVRYGDILITSMTTPEFMPGMKRAAAFVTDEGGITCHAAIVSREMRKPCVIGTKIATKVLMDGDRVQVDATKGMVRKITAIS